jgi:hypothetical protein
MKRVFTRGTVSLPVRRAPNVAWASRPCGVDSRDLGAARQPLSPPQSGSLLQQHRRGFFGLNCSCQHTLHLLTCFRRCSGTTNGHAMGLPNCVTQLSNFVAKLSNSVTKLSNSVTKL